MVANVLAAIGVTVAVTIVWLLRKDFIESEVSVFWAFVAAFFCLLGFSPALFDYLSQQLQISYSPALAFSVAISFIVLKLGFDDVKKSRARIEQKRLIQEMALLELKVKRLEAALRHSIAAD